MKIQATILGIENIRINKAGCLERCELGPTMVIYPDGVWYHYETKVDVDEILERHIQNGEQVDRLLLEPGQIFPDSPDLTPLNVKVSNVREDSAGTKIMDLAAADGGELPTFEAGAHVDVLVDGSGRRSYAIISDTKDTSRYTVGVRRQVESCSGSAWLHDRVNEGDGLEITRPCNLFGLDEEAAEHIFVAGKMGVAPVLSIGRRLSEFGASKTLHLRPPSAADTPFLDDVKEVFGDDVIFHHDGGDVSAGLALKEVLTNPPEDPHLYLSGPPGLIDVARQTAVG